MYNHFMKDMKFLHIPYEKTIYDLNQKQSPL